MSGCSQYLRQPMRTSKPRLGSESQQYKNLIALPEPEEPIVVAVYKFKDQTGQYKDTEIGSSWSTAVTQGATSILLRSLEKTNWFVPIEREGLVDLLNERKIIRSSRAGFAAQDETEKPLLPPLLFAGILLEGGVISFDSNLMTGGAGARYFGLGASGQYRVDRITIYLRAISTSNGRILKTVYTSKTILSQQIDVGIFRFVDFQRLLEAETGFTYNEPSEIAVREAIEKAVMSLIIEGAIDGLWNFKNPADVNSEIVRNYLNEKAENEFIDEFGFEIKERRAKFSAGLNGGFWNYSGDYSHPKTFPSTGLDFEILSNKPMSLNIGIGYGGLGSSKYYQGEIALFDVSANYRWFPKLRSTPYTMLGIGSIFEINNNQSIDASGFNKNYPFAMAELGFEHMLSDRLGLNIGANYRYLFNDNLDGQSQGKYNDMFWGGKVGLKYYFPSGNSKKR